MSVFEYKSTADRRLTELGLSASGVGGAAEAAVIAAIAADPTARGATFAYDGRNFVAARQQASWQVFVLDAFGGQRHLLDLTSTPTSYGRTKNPAIFTRPSWVDRRTS